MTKYFLLCSASTDIKNGEKYSQTWKDKQKFILRNYAFRKSKIADD